jgi:DNA invertase Pin-like site-specific DNA recombinase/peptidoglycan hydrolase-like protein with peptidoglycan-binding domain
MDAFTNALRARVVPVAGLLAATLALGVLFAGSAAASSAYSAASAKPRPLPSTGWHGRPIRRPHERVGRAYFADVRYPAGWSAGAVGYGTGYHRPFGSRRVREIQRRLTRLGYHTGPIDGLYGPLTRSSVQWFQIKHGLRPTGVVAATTLTVLRHPKAPIRTSSTPASLRNTPTPKPERLAVDRTASHSTPAWLIPLLITMLAGMLALVLLAATRSRRLAFLRHRVAPSAEAALPAPVSVPAPAPEGPLTRSAISRAPKGAPVLGYVTSDNLRTAAPHEAAIREACKRHGWKLVHLARDSSFVGGRALARPGLSYALAQLSEGLAGRLVVHELRQLARSADELRVVLSWFLNAGVALTALDVALDTGSPEGEKAARAILSLTVSEPTGATNRRFSSGRGAGGAVADRPELAERIREMRASGMTLQAIADSLNESGVPTVRGGARWRPSSVQSVLGYKRSRNRA